MAKTSKKHYSYGPVWQERTGRLVEMLVRCANDELEERGLDCTWQEGETRRLVVRTQLRVLAQLSTQLDGDQRLKIDQIRAILNHYLPEHLKILEDHRVPQNSPNWHFSLRLESKDAAATVQWLQEHWCGKNTDSNNSQITQTEKPARKSRPLNQGAPFQVPPLPDHFVERPEQQTIVKGQLLNEGSRVGTLVVSAIYGLGGIGKSVLASKLAFDDEVQSRFCDGILWATLGQKPDILPLLSGWIQALGDHDYKPTAIESASNHLRTLLFGKRVLLVVDDIWHPPHLDPFRVGGEGCCVLVTTREARIPEAHRYDLDVMTADQALELMTHKLSGKLTEANRDKALAFADRVGYLPLALELAASQIEEGVLWSELLDDLQAEVARLETLDIYGQAEIPDDAKRRKYSLLACFNLSLKQLAPEQLQQFAWLGVVPEDVSLTQEMAETLWQVTSRQAQAISPTNNRCAKSCIRSCIR
ncbi:MAG: NB-ARC domain-containing protein [Cyanobacteria bacterium J06642_11]